MSMCAHPQSLKIHSSSNKVTPFYIQTWRDDLNGINKIKEKRKKKLISSEFITNILFQLICPKLSIRT